LRAFGFAHPSFVNFGDRKEALAVEALRSAAMRPRSPFVNWHHERLRCVYSCDAAKLLGYSRCDRKAESADARVPESHG
jgi:hypothetical protein